MNDRDSYGKVIGEETMYLWELFDGANAISLRGNEDHEISGITADSRKVRPGMAFFCIRGFYADGNDHAGEALRNGAIALVTERKGLLEQMGQSTVVILVPNARSALARAGARFHGMPAKELTTIGVTGTKGKTTCTYLIRSILENAGRRVGLIGTNEVIIGRQHLVSENTTPDAVSLHGYFRQMADAGLDTVVMEVSSQAIKQKRTEGILFDHAIFTNLSPDHVSPGEHADFQEYLECKRELFRLCRNAVVNGDDPYVERILEGHTCETESYGLNAGGVLWAENLKRELVNGRLGMGFHVAGAMEFDVRLPMPGVFNVYNALGAICLCRHFHVRETDIQRSMLAARVRGRTECVLCRDGWQVLIDYAHNPSALASLLETLREYHPKRMICLFGCGGDRAALRRERMGRISGEKADLTVITDDNPRSEDPAKIRAEIEEGVLAVNGKYVVIPGRREAIAHCLSIAREGDLILLVGKGHETYQEIDGRKLPMDEREIIREIQNET